MPFSGYHTEVGQQQLHTVGGEKVDLARTALKGAKLAYLPSVALAPQGGRAYANGGWAGGWSYNIPASVSWEVDIFGKLLNSKRSAAVAVERSEAYAQSAMHAVTPWTF